VCRPHAFHAKPPTLAPPAAFLNGGIVFPKGLGNLSNLLKQAMDMKSKVEEMRESLGKEVVEASAGGGMVTVTMNGRFELLTLKVEREVINPDEAEMMETLILAAINEAVRKVQELVHGKMAEITGGLGIELPGLI
jgi:DNA-binding YbaB/EbfC family protein